MPRYLLSYRGNAGQPQSKEDGDKSMAAWMAWIRDVGDKMVDVGNPTGASKLVAPNGSVSESGPNLVSGYSIVTAADMTAAIALTKGCPHLAAGNSVEVGELIDVM